jgi:hypothetical protein
MQLFFRLEQDAAIQQALLNLVPQLEKKVMRQALRAAARPLLEQVRHNIAALRITGAHTGPLLRGMRLRALKRRRRGDFGVGIMTPPRVDLGIPPTSKWFYPAHIELGTRRTPARPYMRQALSTKGDAALTILRQAILAGIEHLSQRR